MTRLIVIGLDGLSLPLLQPMLESGDLPVLAQLISNGQAHPMEALFPPYTPSSWTTITTGYDLDRHGLFDFFTVDAGSVEPRLVTDADVCVPRVWHYLTAYGKTSLVVNVPVTHPARPLKGALIPGYLGPECPDCYPEGLLEQLEASIGSYQVYSPWETSPRATFAQQIDGFIELGRLRTAATRYLCKQFAEWDFLMVVFQKTDGIYHLLNRIPAAAENEMLVRTFFRSIDEAIGDILALAPGANVLVVSDHGNGLTPWTFALNSWLRAQGLLVSKTVASATSLEVDERIVKGKSPKGASSNKSQVKWFKQVLAFLGISGSDLEGVASFFGLKGLIRRLVPSQILMAAVNAETIDWRRSKAFCYYPSGLGIRLNVRGREAAGCVTPGDEYEELATKLVSELGGLKDPKGDPVFEWVRHRRDVYGSNVREHVPDILLLPRNMDCRIEKRLRGQLFMLNDNYYSHKLDGLLIAFGPDLSGQGALKDKPTTIDIVPTILHLLNLPICEQMEGRVLLPWLSGDAAQRSVARSDYSELDLKHARTMSSMSYVEEALVEKRLRGLGYLD